MEETANTAAGIRLTGSHDKNNLKKVEVLFGYLRNYSYVSTVIEREMINPILLDESYDVAIMEGLMFENLNGEIKDSGKSGDKRIYETLEWMEEEFKVKL